MTPEERIVAALEGRETDRVPTLSILADPNIINQVMGWKPSPILPFVKSRVGAGLMDRYKGAMNPLADLAMFGLHDLTLRANAKMGFDAYLVCYWRFGIRNHAELQDAFGRVFKLVDDAHGNPYFMYSRGILNTPEQWRRWGHPEVAGYARAAARMYRLLRRRWRNRIAVIPFVGPGVWENLWQPMGFSEFVVLQKKDPGFIREAIGYFTNLCVAMVESFCHAGAPALCLGDDLAYKSGPMLSPDMLDRLFGDAYRQITATARRLGRPIMIHSCGNSEKLLDLFTEWGFNGAHAFEPTAGNDLKEAREKVGKWLCLVGNIDITHILTEANREEVGRAVQEALEKAGGGPFILAPAHTHGDIRVQNVAWMLEAAQRYGHA